MIRLTLLLCGGLYLALMVLGQDHGQKRFGLMLADKLPETVTEPVQVAAKEDTKIFIPAQTVMEATKVSATPPQDIKPGLDLAGATETSLPAPEIPGGQLYLVAASQANVRGGPGKNFTVVDTLTQGEQILMVDDPTAPDGWSKVRIEGDGVEGYVATRLLRPAQ